MWNLEVIDCILIIAYFLSDHGEAKEFTYFSYLLNFHTILSQFFNLRKYKQEQKSKPSIRIH